jgi:hypothetical protein
VMILNPTNLYFITDTPTGQCLNKTGVYRQGWG